MTVLQFRPSSSAPSPGSRRSGGQPKPRVAVRGSFTTPDLGRGWMQGWLRVLHCSLHGSRLCCVGVVSGTLYDGRGRRLGLASTRCVLPVVADPGQDPSVPLHPEASGGVLVGPLEISLLGFQVHVQQARLPALEHPAGVDPASSGVVPMFGRVRPPP